MEDIDEKNLNIRDASPGLEVFHGIAKYQNVLYSTPRMETLGPLAKEYDVPDKVALENKIGNDRKLAQDCVKSLFTSGAYLHGSHSRVIKATFTEISQWGIAACVEVAAELFGSTSSGSTGGGLWASRISRRRERSLERKKRQLEDFEDDRSHKAQRTDY
jgi:hypothetical protein